MGALCPWEILATYAYGIVSHSEGRSCIITLMTSIELARRYRNNSLSAAHVDGAHQHHQPEIHIRRDSPIRPCTLCLVPTRGKQRSPIPTTGLALMSISPDNVPCTVHPGIGRLLHTLENFPRPRNDT